jgi:hypothetical protein
MKRLWLGLLTAGVVAGLVAALLLSRPAARPAGFATPEDCLDAYWDASLAGDVPGLLKCFAEPLRSQHQAGLTAESAWRQLKGVKNWTLRDPVLLDAAATVDVELVRRNGKSLLRFHLRRGAGGWLISGIDPPKELPPGIPYETPAGPPGTPSSP